LPHQQIAEMSMQLRDIETTINVPLGLPLAGLGRVPTQGEHVNKWVVHKSNPTHRYKYITNQIESIRMDRVGCWTHAHA
jgi:hypothetical protein